MRPQCSTKKSVDNSIFAAIYADLLKYCKEYGVRVYHRKKEKMKQADGYYYFRMISISKEIAYTEYGVTVLAHEIGHFLQDINKEYKNLDKVVINKSYTQNGFNLLKEYEVDACKKGQSLVFDRYWVLIDYDEFDDELIENYFKPYWIEHYFAKE